MPWHAGHRPNNWNWWRVICYPERDAMVSRAFWISHPSTSAIRPHRSHCMWWWCFD